MYGFFGKILHIDLCERKNYVEEIDDHIYNSFLGGKGLGTYLLYRELREGVDPLSEENVLIFALGPTTDTLVHGSSRYGVFTKSPLTGIYSESYAGGKTAYDMSKTGFDAFVIKGVSDEPVWIEVNDSSVKFHEAKEIWGRGTFETEEYIKKIKGGGSTVEIGPAGENLVKFAVIENDKWRSCGRTGVGAVMGSKRLKALHFCGNKERKVARPDFLQSHYKDIAKLAKSDKGANAYRMLGTPMMVAIMNNAKAFPTKYWKKGVYERWEEISAEAMKTKCKVRPKACPRCFFACGKLLEVLDGKHKGLIIEGPEYETLYSFGGLCMIDSVEEIAYINHLCDDLGVDTISCGNLCALAIEAKKANKIEYNIDYGDFLSIQEFIRMIVEKRGEGAIFSNGIKEAAKALSLEEIAIHVKGLEPAGYDPRVLKGMGLAYATSDRGACHLRATFYKPELSGMIDPDQIEGKAALFVEFEDRLTIFDALIICRFFRDLYQWDVLSKIVYGTTGKELSEEDFKNIAKNITDLARKFNVREGITRKDDTLPKRFFNEPLPESGKVIREEDLQKMLDDYYKLRGWDENGIPKEV